MHRARRKTPAWFRARTIRCNLETMATLNLTLTGETAALLERLTMDGGFPSPEAALAALLSEQDFEDPALERWLQEVGVARYDAHQADPARTVSVEEARARLLKGA
jgi:hypothetical protein